MMKYLVLVAATAVAVYVGAEYFSPGLHAKMDQELRNFAAWTPEACNADPVRCLEAQKVSLQTSKAQIPTLIAEQQTALNSVESVLEKADQRVTFAQVLLTEARPAYVVAQATPDRPIVLRGRTYENLAAARQQIELWIAEKDGYTAQKAKAQTMRDELRDGLKRLHFRATQIGSELELLGSKEALAKARRNAVDVTDALTRTADVVQSIDTDVATQKDRLVGIDVMLKHQQQAGSAKVPAGTTFEQFLNEKADISPTGQP